MKDADTNQSESEKTEPISSNDFYESIDSLLSYKTFWIVSSSLFVVFIAILLFHIGKSEDRTVDLSPSISEATKLQHVQILNEYNSLIRTKRFLEWSKAMFLENGTFYDGALHARGHTDIAALVKRQYNMVTDFNLTSTSIYHISDSIFMSEGYLSVSILDGSVLLEPIPMFSKFTLAHESKLIQDYLCYLDKTPLLIASGYDITAESTVDTSHKPVLVKRRSKR